MSRKVPGAAEGPGHNETTTAGAGSVVDDRDRAGPAGRAAMHLHREADHLEAVGRQRFQVVQLLQVANSRSPARPDGLPRSGRRSPPCCDLRRGVAEGRVPGPAIGADQRGRRAPAATASPPCPCRSRCRCSRPRRSGCRRGCSPPRSPAASARGRCACSSVSTSAGLHDVAIGEVAEVELHAGLVAPVQRHLVDAPGRLAARLQRSFMREK